MKSILIPKLNNSSNKYDPTLLENLEYGIYDGSHIDIANKLRDKKIFTITTIIDRLNPKFWKNKQYVKKTQRELITLYKELLYNYFFDEFGNENGNKIYGDWLDKYRQQWQDGKKNSDLDDLIIKHELEPRYKKRILQKYKDKEKLLKPRFVTERCRYYNLPEPLDRVDWRTPYDNIFIWQEGNKKFCTRGGSGSSGSREKNSKFIYAFARLNKIKPIPSYLFIYSEENQLNFIKKFNQLTIPRYDIGENYHLDQKEHRKLLSDCQMISWKNFEVVNKILISKFV